MHEVYLGPYRRNPDGLPVATFDEVICGMDRIDTRNELFVAAGGAWQKYPELLARNKDSISDVVDVTVPRARHLLGLGASAIAMGRAVAPEELVPAYLRTKVAEIPAPTA